MSNTPQEPNVDLPIITVRAEFDAAVRRILDDDLYSLSGMANIDTLLLMQACRDLESIKYATCNMVDNGVATYERN